MKSGKPLQTAAWLGICEARSLAILTPRFEWLFVLIALIAVLVLTVDYRISLPLTVFSPRL
jgi:hypothetical protein